VQSAEQIIQELEQAGFRAAFLPISAMEQIRENYDTLEQRAPATGTAKGTAKRFQDNQPPKLEFEPKSILSVAYPYTGAKLALRRGGREIEIPIPPNCLDCPAEWQIKEILKAGDCKFAHTAGISQKLLAALSGLGQYGRNNICYIGEWGSCCGMCGFYTDIFYEGPVQSSLRMEACEGCELCRAACPTGAIGETQVIDANRCLAHVNNGHEKRIPRWVPKDAHHTLVECLRCQECCPQNPPIDFGRTLALDEAETKQLLSRSKKMPERLAQKFRAFGLGGWNMRAIKRNAGLAVKAKET